MVALAASLVVVNRMLRALLSLLVTSAYAFQQPRTMCTSTKRLKSTPVDVELVPVGASEVAHLHSLEAASYPADEAASLESFVLRQREAGAYFRKCMVGGELAGFICGTRCEAFTEASMDTHAAAGPVLAIHSVVTAPAFRRRGVALEGLRQYAEAVAGDGVASVKLIAKAPLLGLYARAGFAVDGLSAIVHGKDPWFECTRDATTVACKVCDSFATEDFSGNPAAVVFRHGDGAWMAKVAAEFNLSETAFLERRARTRYGLRWFTPSGAEVDLCGHGTLAAAHALFEDDAALDEVAFDSRSGVLNARKLDGGFIELDFPKDAPADVPRDADLVSRLQAALGVPAIASLHKSPLSRDLLVVVSLDDFRNAAPDGARLARIEDVRGVVLCCAGDARGGTEADFSSRFFGPAIGIDEDPVTGSAHCALAPHFRDGDGAVVGYQASPRGGVVRCVVAGDRVKLAGQARTVIAGAVNR